MKDNCWGNTDLSSRKIMSPFSRLLSFRNSSAIEMLHRYDNYIRIDSLGPVILFPELYAQLFLLTGVTGKSLRKRKLLFNPSKDDPYELNGNVSFDVTPSLLETVTLLIILYEEVNIWTFVCHIRSSGYCNSLFGWISVDGNTYTSLRESCRARRR